MEVREETITSKPLLQGKNQNTLDTIKKKKKTFVDIDENPTISTVASSFL